LLRTSESRLGFFRIGFKRAVFITVGTNPDERFIDYFDDSREQDVNLSFD